MPAALIEDIRTALAAQITTNAGLRGAPTVPGQVSPPAAVVRPSRQTVVDYQQTFDGAANFFFEVTVLASTASDRAGQTLLDQYLSPTGPLSIYAAVEADPTLGGVVSGAHVIRASGYGLIEWAGIEYVASTLLVEVMAP